MKEGEQLLKCRDDKAPVILSRITGEATVTEQFKLTDGSECSWLSKDQTLGPTELRPRIEPWLTALFQSEHLSLLVGSGLTHAVHHIATGKTLPGMNPAKFTHYETEISAEAKKSAAIAGRENGNIEDQIRVANELLRGLTIMAGDSDDLLGKAASLKTDLKGILEAFSASILTGERGLISAEAEELEKAFNYLVSFLMSFASRTGTRDRLQIFTTNYDRFIEMGADVAGLHLLDRFCWFPDPYLSVITTGFGHALQSSRNSRRAALSRRRGTIHQAARFPGLGGYAE